MDPPAWHHEYETGQPRLDGPHRVLVEAMAVVQQASPDGKGVALLRLRTRTAAHFRVEEEQMAACAYPGRYAHARIHGELLGELDGLIRRFGDGLTPLPPPVLAFLESWLTDHFQSEDLRFAEFLDGRG